MKTAIISTLALISIAGPALAAPVAPRALPSVSVSYRGLDLSNAKDAATMLKRIKRASTEVCRQALGYVENDIDSIVWVRDCARQAVANAVSGLNAPRVTEAFAPAADRQRLARLP